MTTEVEHIMPDFVAALERRLHAAAQADDRRRGSALRHPRRRAKARVGLAAVSAVAVAGALFVLLAADRSGAPPAYGKPLILLSPPIDPHKQLEGGLTLRTVLGENAKLETIREVSAFGGTAYVYKVNRGWCLSAPDPAAPQPEIERGVTCAGDATFLKYGISLRLGQHYLAAVPQGVRDPTLRKPDGDVVTLSPSDDGIVVVDNLTDGSVITLFGPDGRGRADEIRGKR